MSLFADCSAEEDAQFVVPERIAKLEGFMDDVIRRKVQIAQEEVDKQEAVVRDT